MPIPAILVTGATGFIGATLCKALQARDRRARRAVRHAEGLLPGDVAIGDIDSSTDWHEALEQITAVVHLAARTHVLREPSSDPITQYRLVNVAASERLARTAADAGVKRFVFLSSVKVNGEQTPEHPFTEHSPAQPEDAYGSSKWEAEQALAQIAKETGMAVVILRAPLVYGPGVKANFLRLMRLVARGVPLPFASLNNRRSLIYVGNLVDAIITCLEAPAAAGKTYLVSDGEDVSTPDLIRVLAAGLDVPARLFRCPAALLRAGASMLGRGEEMGRLIGSLRVDSSRIRNELGWRPHYSFEEGIQETARWFKAVQNTHPHPSPPPQGGGDEGFSSRGRE